VLWRRATAGHAHGRFPSAACPRHAEEDTITKLSDMTELNDLHRSHLVGGTIDPRPQTGERGIDLKQELESDLIGNERYVDKRRQDLPNLRNWQWDTSR
jgi:xylulose-5-phosphate/fructose-6-phosphate phosphoketolase